MYDIAVLTDERYIKPKNQGEHVKNVLREDQMVVDALREEGLKVIRLAWSDPDFDWTTTKTALFRTTWDYAERFTEFTDWLIRVAKKTKLINPYDLIVWNLDKHYLEDLNDKGINVVETRFIEPKDPRSLAVIHEELGWTSTVLKPAISAAAKDTFKLDLSSINQYENQYSTLIEHEAMMLQPFQESVLERGEISLMVFGGQYTHAVLKIAKAGDFRVQDDFGGTVHEYHPTEREIKLAIDTVNACDTMPYYARVDIVTDNDGNPAVSELELVEPELWFRRNERSSTLMAKAIRSGLF